MKQVSGLIPSRFLTLTVHLIVLIMMIIDRDVNVKSCLPGSYTKDQYQRQDNELLGGLMTAIGLTAVEVFGFISGISMFATLPSFLSTLLHAGGAITLSVMLVDAWDCQLFWVVFTFTSLFPAIIEFFVIGSVLFLKKNN